MSSTPTIVTRESWMNFQIGQLVTYKGQEAFVKRLDSGSRKVRISMAGTDACEWVKYWDLKIVEMVVVKDTNRGKEWTAKEIKFMLDNPHMNSDKMAKILGRTWKAVLGKRHKVKNDEGLQYLIQNINKCDPARPWK